MGISFGVQVSQLIDGPKIRQVTVFAGHRLRAGLSAPLVLIIVPGAHERCRHLFSIVSNIDHGKRSQTPTLHEQPVAPTGQSTRIPVTSTRQPRRPQMMKRATTKRDTHMMHQVAFAFLGAVALACGGWSAASAQDKRPGYVPPPGMGPSHRPPVIARGLPTPPRGLRPARKQCFWRDAQGGGSFGTSGTCTAASSAAVGSRCGCYLKGHVHPGTIMAMQPVAVGPTRPVR